MSHSYHHGSARDWMGDHRPMPWAVGRVYRPMDWVRWPMNSVDILMVGMRGRMAQRCRSHHTGHQQ